jgi:hypothetical protein
LQMTSFIMVAASTAFSLWGMRTRLVGMVYVSFSSKMLLLDVTQNWLYLTKYVNLVLKLCCFRYFKLGL